jgi:hypothetical protein
MWGLAVLFGVSALIGFGLGGLFSWVAIGIAGVVLAFPVALISHLQGFGALSGIGIVVACLTVNQIAYLGGFSVHRRSGNEIGGAQQQQELPSAPTGLVLQAFDGAAYSRLAEECFFLAASAQDPKLALELTEKGDDFLRRAAPGSDPGDNSSKSPTGRIQSSTK